MKPTIKDVAKLAGVSFKTVSRVINNEPTVREVSRRRVWEAVKELNYHPNLSARHLRGAPSSIGLIYDNPNSNYIIEMQQGVLDQCREKRFELVIHPCDSTSSDIGEEIQQMVFRGRVSGLVLTPPLSERADIVSKLKQEDISHVRIVSGSEPPDDISPCVFVDDQIAAYDVTKHLIILGHRRIAFLSGDPAHGSNDKRLAGYMQALNDYSIEVDQELILEGQYSFESGAERAILLMAHDILPTALFACNDEIAAGAMFHFQNNGLRVPQDISIAGFEDNPFSRHTWPRLTTARQNNNAISQRAAELLISEIVPGRHETASAADNRFRPVLVVRESTGPAKSD